MTADELRERLNFKPHVMPAGAHPQVQSAIVTFVEVVWDIAKKESYITSMCDSIHGEHSFHYWCMAFDGRSKHLEDSEKDAVLEELKRRIGPGWDIILEARNTTNEHFHLEWDRGREHKIDYMAQLQDEFVDQLLGEAA